MIPITVTCFAIARGDVHTSLRGNAADWRDRLIRICIASLFLMVFPLFTAAAEPAVKVINFTADWCPNCRVLNPRLAEALDKIDTDEAVRVDLDLTDVRGNEDEAARTEVINGIIAQTYDHKVRYLWDWYGGFTGIAVIVAADNGEPLSCLHRRLSANKMADLIRESLVLAQYSPPGKRRPEGPDCPAPMQ